MTSGTSLGPKATFFSKPQWMIIDSLICLVRGSLCCLLTENWMSSVGSMFWWPPCASIAWSIIQEEHSSLFKCPGWLLHCLTAFINLQDAGWIWWKESWKILQNRLVLDSDPGYTSGTVPHIQYSPWSTSQGSPFQTWHRDTHSFHRIFWGRGCWMLCLSGWPFQVFQLPWWRFLLVLHASWGFL